MKIKDIRQFRTLYKNQIREIDSSNRNEHFVGVRTENNGKSQYGFFEIYHGDKEGFNESDGIRGFLEGFLDMAKDGQAVYEFMQNAVDAKSTKFCLFWGKDEVDGNTYLLVVNNGSMFNMDSVRSILNVGVSTKSSNNFTIGKFGIGFKLAHRLVGRENGLDELIHQNYGPILFSWRNSEIAQLENLIDTPTVFPETQIYEIISEKGKRKAIIKTDDPWLFKILITNFPCQPENDSLEEIIFDNQYVKTKSAFSKSELQVLGRWVKSHSAYLADDFQQGSLFFIRLGQGKQSHLEEENLEEGVKFSLAILNKIAMQSLDHEGLKTVNLRGKELQPIDLLFQSFIISKTNNRDQYRYLRFGKTENLSEVEQSKEEADNDIEILLGFTEYKKAKDAFHNAPNFYLFFPLSEEKHKLRFIIHSNAFYKSASRTFLQKGSVGEEGINEHLFRIFIEKLKERMLLWANNTDKIEKDKFIELYANLLLSDASDNPERVWINEPLYEPILEFIKTNIPVKDIHNNSFTLVKSAFSVRIKNTALPADVGNWLSDTVSWFYWDKEQDLSLYLEAISNLKLNIKTVSIIQLLEIKDIHQKINPWLNNEYEKIELVLKELNEQLTTGDAEIKQTDAFKENISHLKLWKFTDDKCLSISEIADPQTHSSRLLVFGKIDDLTVYLKQSGFVLSTVSLSQYPQLFKYIQINARLIKYFNDYSYLTQLFNHKFTTAKFIASDKHKILKLIEKLGDDRSTEDRIERIKLLALFSNQQDQVIPFKKLLANTSYNWLQPYVVKQSENADDLKEYLVADETHIYVDIILAFWDDIVTSKNFTSLDIKNIYQTVQALYTKIPKAAILSDKKIIKINTLFQTEAEPYYFSQTLIEFTEQEFADLKSIAHKLDLPPLPDYELLPFYIKPPFKISETKISYSITNANISTSEQEAKIFLKLCYKEDPEIFKKIVIHQNAENEIIISNKTESLYPVVSDNPKINDYIRKYHSSSFRILPKILSEFGANIVLQGDKLINRLSYQCSFEDETQLSELIELVVASGIDARIYLADKFGSIIFNINTKLVAENIFVRFVQLMLSLNDINKASQIIRKTVSVISGETTIKLSDTHLLGQNEIIFEQGEKKFTLLLSSILLNPDSNATKIIGQLTESLTALITVDKQILDTVFGLTRQTNKEFIYHSLQSEYATLPLVNAHQVAFLLHYANEKPAVANLDNFTVNTDQKTISLKGASIYCKNSGLPFLSANIVLNSQYEGLEELIFDGQSYFKAPHNTRIYYHPYFENNRFFIPEISVIADNVSRLYLLNLLFTNWKQDEERFKIIELADKKKWHDLLGFEPTSTIIGNELVLDAEKLPLFIDKWVEESEQEVNSKKRYEFFRSLGVSLSGSDIVRVRKFLVGEDTIMPGINYNLPEALVMNTLILLSNRGYKFDITGQKSELLKELFHRLPDDIDFKSIPLPVIDTDYCHSLVLSYVTDAEYIDNQVISQLDDLKFEINKLPIAINKKVIYASLFRTVNNINKIFDPVRIDVDILDTESIEMYGKEWDRNFYNYWKLSNPKYKIINYPGNIPYLLQYGSSTIFKYNRNEITFNDNAVVVNNEKNDKSIIALIEFKNFLPVNVLLQLKELFNQYDDSIQDFLNRIQSNPKLKQEFEKLKQKDQIEQKKKDLSEGVTTAKKYSMKWFMNLLELMVMSSGDSGSTVNPHGDITFTGLEYNPADLRLLTFTNPSSTISPNIDIYTNFNSTFIYLDESGNKKTKQVKISGVSKKGSRLVVIPSNVNELELINLSQVKEIQLTFNRMMDLLKELTNSFRELAFDDEYNLYENLSENIQFIFGPPGTGKTTEVSKMVLERMCENDDKKILILTPSNNAADVLVKRILALASDQDYPDGWLVRFGASVDEALRERKLIYDDESFKYHLYSKCVVVTTIQRFPYQKVTTHVGVDGEVKSRMSNILWDTVIFDEASMIMLPAIVYPLFKRKFKTSDEKALTEFIIGGDPFQIPPIYDISDDDLGEENIGIKEENIYSMIALKSFDEDLQVTIPKYGSNTGNKIKNLPVQFRSIESIGTIFSKLQYDNKLDHGRNKGQGGESYPKKLPHYFEALGFKPVTVIRYPVNTEDAIYTPQKLNGSPFHIYSAFLINELVMRFREEASESWSVGVTSPYRPQTNLMNTLLESHRDKSKLNITTDTVHGFQGGECDIVFVVFNPSSLFIKKSRFFQDEYRFIVNVAVSRARDYLVLLIPDSKAMNDLPLFYNENAAGLMNIIEGLPPQDVADLKAIDVEQQLMGNRYHFQTNSFTNAHQSVNVYCDLFRDYIVRYSTSSIDVHIKPR